ncbi:DUF2306 domain-containing protein [Ahniella affigens]|nr:DUF2306 domain-containing protein [Ahniella affigens]
MPGRSAESLVDVPHTLEPPARSTLPPSAQRSLKALRLSAGFWFLIALVGQWLFAWYIAMVYARPVLSGTPEAINNTAKITGYIVGDGLGNSLLISHVLAGGLISMLGLLQLWPWLRRRVPGLHRWNGRLFLALGMLGALSGLYLTWIRGSRLSDLGAIGISINGILILIAAVLAWVHARNRNLGQHRQWAIRAFLLVNGVWMFRLGLTAWLLLNQGPNGNTAKLDGPFDLAWSVGCYLVPIALAELYFRAESSRSPTRQWLSAGALGASSLLMALGVFGAWLMLWRPHL